jgi:hypothetical protein
VYFNGAAARIRSRSKSSADAEPPTRAQPDFRRFSISDRRADASSILLAFEWMGAHHPLARTISDVPHEQEITGSIG